jgi:hypothetical protein
MIRKGLVISRATDGVFCHRLKDYTEINGSIYFLCFTKHFYHFYLKNKAL